MSGRKWSADEVIDIIVQDSVFYRNSGGGVTFGGGECTAQFHFLMELVLGCRDRGIHVCLDTCGFCQQERFRELIPLADLFLYDFKCMDPAIHCAHTGVDNALILNNARYLLENAPEKMCVRMPLIPGVNDTKDNIAQLAAFLLPYGKNAVDIMPYHTFGRNKYQALGRVMPLITHYDTERLVQVRDIFSGYRLTTQIV